MIENANNNEEKIIDNAEDGDVILNESNEKETDIVQTSIDKEDFDANQYEVEKDDSSDQSNNVTEADKTDIDEKETIKKGKSNCFFASLLAIVIDEIVVLGLSAAILFISNFIMQFLGYYISEKLSMLFVLFLVINIIYTAAMEASKFNGTLGKLVSNLKVHKLGE